MAVIIGIGTDILAIERIERALSSPAFLRFTFTRQEIDRAGQHARPALYFARLFAAKEAVFKALHMNGDELRHWNCIEIHGSEHRDPGVQLYREAAAAGARQNLSCVRLSLASSHRYAQAFAVAEGESTDVRH